MKTRTSTLLRVVALLLIAAEVTLFFVLDRRFASRLDDPSVPGPEVRSAVPELSRARHAMRVAEQALREGDGSSALEALESATFGPRQVETYRRYYLATAKELVGERVEARSILARLWNEDPRFVPRIDVAFHLADLYGEAGDWQAAAAVLRALLDEDREAVRNTAYQRLRPLLVAVGDPASMIAISRDLAIAHPASEAGKLGASDLGSLGVTLSRRERVERAQRLASRGNTDEARAEIEKLRRTGTSLKLEIARAELLARTGKRDDADRVVLALVGQSVTLDPVLLRHSWRWWNEAAQSIEARAWRTIRVRRRSGTKRGRPVYTWANRRVKRSLGRADRGRLAAVNAKLLERGERLLTLDIDDELRKEVHQRLAEVEVKPRRQARLEEHVARLVELDPRNDDKLQLLWDEGWAAWIKRDLDTARERFAFIFRTYRRPSIQRQARYWYARALEESGEKEEAERHYVELQKSTYDDLYALLAKGRFEATELRRTPFVPFDARQDGWVADAERDMPAELRLAWELSLLGLHHEAREEIRANATSANLSWRYAILARIHRADEAPLLVSHAIRQAYPQIGTVEQDTVPVHFLRMYYPRAHHEDVETRAARRGLDPALVKALILQESGYDPSARSSAGAKGLMQLMAPTAREVASRFDRHWDESRLADPAYNIEIGTYYLSTLMSEFDGNPLLSLAAYNGGIGNVRRWLRRDLKGRAPDEIVDSIPFSETRGYVKRVVFYRSVYAQLD